MVSQQEYEYLARRATVEALLAGELPSDQLRGLDLEPEGRHFALIRFAVATGQDRLRDALLGHFLKYPEYILLDWGVREYLVILKAEPGDMDRCISRCVCAIRESHASFGVTDWYAAVTPPVDSPAALPGCYETLSRLWAHRYLRPSVHLLTRETVGKGTDEEERLLTLDAAMADPARLRDILEQASAGEVPELVGQLLGQMGEALNSDSFCRYLALSARFTAARFAAERGCDQQEFIRSYRLTLPGDGRFTEPVLADYLTRTLQAAIHCREGDLHNTCRGVLRQATAYVGSHFSQVGLSLDQVAAAVDLSPNYLSSLFRKELDCTFVEFVTGKRMELARELLETTDLRAGQVAQAVGYRDPRYFSSLFKKTQGMTPREYRAGRKNSDG